MMNHPNPYDLARDEARHAALADAEPLASLLGEQLLVLQRIERSLETLMTRQNQAIQPETPSSVEITRGAKGTPQWSIKVYCAVGDEQAAKDLATEIDAQLQTHYWGEVGHDR